jgi:hypothetical protein
MERRILLVVSACLILACDGQVAKLIDKAGYEYVPAQDIYATKTTAWQRKAGYDRVFDQASAPAGMIIDCEPVKFTHAGKPYMIELWKGQYDLSTGTEIGIYKKAAEGPLAWECGEDGDMLDMSYVVKKNGVPLYRQSGVHWWLTGFKPGEFSEPAELVMEVQIDFGRVPAMKDPFVEALRQLGYGNVVVQGLKVQFTYDRPKSPQPAENALLVTETQKKNRELVEEYNRAKVDSGATDNSPASIEKILKKSPKLVLSLIKRRM